MKKEKILPLIMAFWFFVTINSFFTWNSLKPLFHIVPMLLIVILSFPFLKKRNHYDNANTIVFSLFILVVWVVLRLNSHINVILLRLFDFIPLFFIFYMPKSYLSNTYDIIRKVFIFYSIGGAIIVLLSIFGVLGQIPHFVLPAQETIHKDLGLNYNVYGVFPILDTRETFVRCFGMTVEPGHFSIYLGLVYMVDRLMNGKINYWFFPGAFAAFSSTFFIIFIATEVIYLLFSNNRKHLFKYVMYLFGFILVIVSVYTSIPKAYKTEIDNLFYGRNLEQATEILEATNSLDEALNTRASVEGLSIYDNIDGSTFLFGGEELTDILSDYRGLIVTLGVVGIFFSFVCVYNIVKLTPVKMKLLLFVPYILVLLHRSWMIPHPCIYVLFFFMVSLSLDSKFYSKRKLRTPVKNIENKFKYI